MVRWREQGGKEESSEGCSQGRFWRLSPTRCPWPVPTPSGGSNPVSSSTAGSAEPGLGSGQPGDGAVPNSLYTKQAWRPGWWREGEVG